MCSYSKKNVEMDVSDESYWLLYSLGSAGDENNCALSLKDSRFSDSSVAKKNLILMN